MPIQFDKFDQQKIDRLKNHLESLATKGAPKYYEIFVDGLKAVPKTNEPNEFDGYENYMSPDTGQIKIVIYCSGASPRNDQYVFSMKAKSNEEALDYGLNGIAVKSFTTNELKELRLQRDQKAAFKAEITQLNSDLDAAYKELDEKEAYIATLEKAVLEAKANGNKIGGIHAGEVLSVALESYMKRNAKNFEKQLGVEGLSGLLGADETRPIDTTTQQSEVTLKKKNSDSESVELSEQDKNFLALFHQIQKHFSQMEMDQVVEIIEALSKDKSKINLILDLLSEESHETTSEKK